MIQLTMREDGVVLPVRAQPGARADAVRGLHDGALKVAVTQVAEKGKANKAIAKLLCKSLALRRSQIALMTGETNANKQFLVRGVTLNELAQRIDAVVKDVSPP